MIAPIDEEAFRAVSRDRVLDLWTYLSKKQAEIRDEQAFASIVNIILLYIAAEGALSCLQALLGDHKLSHYLDYNTLDDDGDSPLLLSVKQYHIKLANTFLMQHETDISIRNVFGQTALDVACMKRIYNLLPELTNLDRVLFKLSHKDDDITDSDETVEKYQYTALVTAVDSDAVHELQYLLERGFHVNLNLDDDIGSPLHCAAETGSLECLELLLSKGADIEALRRCIMQTPLMRATEFGHLPFVKRLLEVGVEIDRMTEHCSTALTVACHFGFEEIASLFLDQGADPSIPNAWGFTALYMATDSPVILREVLGNHKVNVNERCGERLEAPLHLAAVVGCEDSFEQLLEAGADIDSVTKYNETALWLAVWKGHNHIVHQCLRRNCDISTPSNGCQVYLWKYTPLELALGSGNLEAACMIHFAGAKLFNTEYFSHENMSTSSLYPSWVRLRPEVLDFVSKKEDVSGWFNNTVQHPRSLCNHAVVVIRKCLGKEGFLTKVGSLPIPTKLRALVAMVNEGCI